MSAIDAALRQVKNEEVEYQPGYFVWQMEAEVRDIIEAAARLSLGEATDSELVGELVKRGVLTAEPGWGPYPDFTFDDALTFIRGDKDKVTLPPSVSRYVTDWEPVAVSEAGD